LEPVCIPILLAGVDAEAFGSIKPLFDDYIRAFVDWDLEAARAMIDFWFGPSAFQHLPGPVRDFLVKSTASNVHDVRASFRERYSPEAMRKLDMPVRLVYGSKSPDASYRVASTVAALAPKGSLVKVDGATHALTATHSGEVAELIAALATQSADGGQPEKV
ncbi:MAG: alpha/beta fold hydrolase, partial [Burkholderiales bacterium]